MAGISRRDRADRARCRHQWRRDGGVGGAGRECLKKAPRRSRMGDGAGGAKLWAHGRNTPMTTVQSRQPRRRREVAVCNGRRPRRQTDDARGQGMPNRPTGSRIRLSCLLCGLTFLVGCYPTWVKPGATSQDFYRDRSTCSDEAQRPGGAPYRDPFTGLIAQSWYTNRDIFNACMREHGWAPEG